MNGKWRVERCGSDYAWRVFSYDTPWYTQLFESWNEAMRFASGAPFPGYPGIGPQIRVDKLP